MRCFSQFDSYFCNSRWFQQFPPATHRENYSSVGCKCKWRHERVSFSKPNTSCVVTVIEFWSNEAIVGGGEMNTSSSCAIDFLCIIVECRSPSTFSQRTNTFSLTVRYIIQHDIHISFMLQGCALCRCLLPQTSEMSMNVEMRRVDLHLVGQDLNDGRDRGGVLHMEEKPMSQQNTCLPFKHTSDTFTKQHRTHRVVCVVREELHLQHLLLLDDPGQEGREEQQRSQVPQHVRAVSQHALTTAGQHTSPWHPHRAGDDLFQCPWGMN